MAISYQYNAEGYFAGEIEDYGVLPSNATNISPAIKEGYINKWNGKKWELVENHVGMEGYINGQAFTIKEFGPLPEGWSLEKPEPTAEEKVKRDLRRIDESIEELEKKVIRPLLAIQTGIVEEYDKERFTEITQKITNLRLERQRLYESIKKD